jgi:hypothetical protein
VIRAEELTKLRFFTQIVKLNLSGNRFGSLPPPEVMSQLTTLKLLYVEFNNLSSWQDIESIVSIQSLIHINMSNNSITSIPGYRHYIVRHLPGLLALDDYIITDEERWEDVSFGKRFRALSPHLRIYIPDFMEGLTADQHKFHLDVEIYKLKRLFEKNSPSVRI